jgi:hypothetical protein
MWAPKYVAASPVICCQSHSVLRSYVTTSLSRNITDTLNVNVPAQASVKDHRTVAERTMDVLHLRYIEQTVCFMFLLKSLIDGPSSTLTRRRNGSKTVDATHPFVAQHHHDLNAPFAKARLLRPLR